MGKSYIERNYPWRMEEIKKKKAEEMKTLKVVLDGNKMPDKMFIKILKEDSKVVKITKAKFGKYVAVQMSGVTNMFDVPVVMKLSGLTKEECIDIMKKYSEYKTEFKVGRP